MAPRSPLPPRLFSARQPGPWISRCTGSLMRRPALAREIAAVLCLKLAMLMALKYAFFNHPQAPHMELPPADVAQALLAVPATPMAPEPRQGNHHAQ